MGVTGSRKMLTIGIVTRVTHSRQRPHKIGEEIVFSANDRCDRENRTACLERGAQ
jgi:hypothetical protein